MSDKYEARMDNNYYSYHKDYWEVTVKANSLNNLSNVCNAINLLRKGINVADQGVKLDFLIAENKHMKSVLDENKKLKEPKKDPNQPGSLAQQMRRDISMTKWKREVHDRDQVCQCCGDTVDLECHHVMPLSQYPSIGTDPGNGILLCGSCHQNYHKAYEGSESAVTLAKFMKEFGQFQ